MTLTIKAHFSQKINPHLTQNQYGYSDIHLYVLLSPYLCFISFLYFDLYVLGEYSWIR